MDMKKQFSDNDMQSSAGHNNEVQLVQENYGVYEGGWEMNKMK